MEETNINEFTNLPKITNATCYTCFAVIVIAFLGLLPTFASFSSSQPKELYIIATSLKTVEKYLYFIFSKTPGSRRRIGTMQTSFPEKLLLQTQRWFLNLKISSRRSH